MKVAAIIAEYNPFHRGHLYHIEKTREVTGCTHVLVVMSGYYTQRGEPAVFSPHTRARQALLNGADVVLELPSLFSCASAEPFAYGAFSLIHKLGVCDFLSFGSEVTDINLLKQTAYALSKEPKDYRILLQSYLKKGVSFPKARALALTSLFPYVSAEVLEGSNTILGLEYLKAIYHFESAVQPIAIKRIHNNYRDTALSENNNFSSAAAIRNYLSNGLRDSLVYENNELQKELSSAMPHSFFTADTDKTTCCYPIFPKDFSLLLQHKLLSQTPDTLAEYEDVSKELASRIYHYRYRCSNMEEFCLLLKTKEITYTRISRCLLHVILNIKKEDMAYYKKENYCPYGRILGFRKSATDLLHSIKKSSSLPLIAKTAKAALLLTPRDYLLFQKEIEACHIYEAVRSHKYGCAFENEYLKSPVIL